VAAGDCLRNIGTLFDTPPPCMSREQRGLERACISSLKAVKAV